MNGFNLIPKKNNTAASEDNSGQDFPTSPLGGLNLAMDNSGPAPRSKEINPTTNRISENPENPKTLMTESLVKILISLFFIGSLVYCGYLFFLRFDTLTQIEEYSFRLRNVETKISKKEIEEFKYMDTILKSMKSRLSDHILPTFIFSFLNKNMRNTVQVTEYKVENKESGVDVSFQCIAPTFKDMAEQTEKMTELKKSSQIKNFSLSNLFIETDTGKIRFTIKVEFDRSKVSAQSANINQN
jgi:hypothetical protein